MLFTDFKFWILFPIVFLIFWAIPKNRVRGRNLFLVLVSYALYMNWNPYFSLVLLFVTLVTFWGAKALVRNKKGLLPILVVLVLFPLLGFKYYNFVNCSLASLLDFAHVHFALPGLNWAIPVGISFFTFQALGYMLDVYHGRAELENDFVDYMLFCSFFPQTASGPISKASELFPQIKKPSSFDYGQVRNGLQILLWGLFLKLFVADRLGIFVQSVMENYVHFSGPTCFLASVFYTFQIYADFAGYSFMAVGLGKALGFNLVNNFERPYFAVSITQFWRRWHISLTRWLTTHVYISLGGNRCSKARQYFNIMVTFLVSGLWHGANWTFVVWGGIHGILQIIEKALGLDPKGRHADSKVLARLKPVRILVTFLLVNFAWIFFMMPSIEDGARYIGRIFFEFSGPLFLGSNTNMLLALLGIMIVFCKEGCEEFFPKVTLFNNRFVAVRWVTYLVMTAMLLAFGVLDSSNFLYVNF